MRTRRLTAAPMLAIVAALSAAPAGAHPPAPVDELARPVRGDLHTWMHGAKVPLIRGRLMIRRSACPGYPAFAGCVFTARPRTLYLLPGLRNARSVLYHELGHAFDLRVLNWRERRRFKRIIGIRRSGWFEGAAPPMEWFADGYATCAVRSRLPRAARPTLYRYAPTPRQHARVCGLIREAAKPRGRRPRPPANPPPVFEVAPPPTSEGGPGSGCTLVDELLTGCRVAPPPAPAPPI